MRVEAVTPGSRIPSGYQATTCYHVDEKFNL